MSILVSESYSNKSSQLWRSIQPSTPAPITYSNAFGSTLLSSTGYPTWTITGLNIGQRYEFSLNGLITSSGLGITLAGLNDGTNMIGLQCIASTLPTELTYPSGNYNNLNTNFAGLIQVFPTWMTMYNGGTNSPQLPILAQFTLTAQTTSLSFTLASMNTNPTVANTSKVIRNLNMVYTQPIV